MCSVLTLLRSIDAGSFCFQTRSNLSFSRGVFLGSFKSMLHHGDKGTDFVSLSIKSSMAYDADHTANTPAHQSSDLTLPQCLGEQFIGRQGPLLLITVCRDQRSQGSISQPADQLTVTIGYFVLLTFSFSYHKSAAEEQPM